MTKPYYGWWIVLGSILTQFIYMTLSATAIGVFIRPVVDDLGWKVWQFTLGSSIATGTGALSSIFMGKFVDAKGPRLLLLIGALISALCLFLISQQSNLVVFLILYAIGGLVGWGLFSTTIISATISKWFIKKRGWALAMGSLGVSLSGLVIPVTLTIIVDSFSWRTGYAILAILVLIIVIPTSLIMRRTPEDYGLKPDGNSDESEQKGMEQPEEVPSLTRSEAITTRSFWLLVIGFGLNSAALASLLVHAIPVATEAGFSRNIAAIALTIAGIGNLASKFVWGFSLQRFEPRTLALIAFSISATSVGLIIVSSSTSQTSILLAAFLFWGFGFGATIPLSGFLWAKYFGRHHIGSIKGVGQALTTIGIFLGPVLVGYWFDVSLTYQPALITIMGLYLAGAIFIWVSREPNKIPQVLNIKSKTNIRI